MNSRRKLLAVLLLVVMAVSLLSVCAFAADGEDAAKSITCTTCSGTGVSQGAECDVCEGTGVITNMIGLKGFAAGVLGGFGYMPGCIAGGLVLGIVENIASMILPSVYKDVVAFVLLVAFLLFRPQGLMLHSTSP